MITEADRRAYDNIVSAPDPLAGIELVAAHREAGLRAGETHQVTFAAQTGFEAGYEEGLLAGTKAMPITEEMVADAAGLLRANYPTFSANLAEVIARICLVAAYPHDGV